MVPKTVLTRRRSMVARLTVVAMIASLMAIAAPASAATIDTSASCPSSIPAAGFTDIVTLDAATQQAINCIAYYKITTGVTATTFGPLGDVPRWQMALFLTRQATAHGLTLPDGAPQGFTDIGSYDAATQTAINQIKQLNITKGTSATTFDPEGLVTREQMALFLARLAGVASISLPASPPDAFADDNALSAESQLAINQLAAAGVAAGTSATTFSPAANNLRWHMALFLSRVLAAGGIVPTGQGNFVWKVNTAANEYWYANAASCASVKVTYKSTDKFFVNGTAATELAFEAALNGLDFVGGTNNGVVETGATSHTLTTAVKVTSSVVGTTVHATGEFWFHEPVSGNVLSKYTPSQTYVVFTVDGATTNLQSFKDDISLGDTVAVTGGDGTTAAKVRTYALVNGTLSGTAAANISPIADQDIPIDTACASYVVNSDDPAGDTFSYSVDGVTKTEGVFNGSVTVNDIFTYARAAKKSTFTLTNQAQPAYVGVVSDFDSGAKNVRIAKSSTATRVVNWVADVATLRVNGAVASVTDFEAALSLGDGISHQVDNPATTANESYLNLTTGAFSGTPKTFATPNIQLTLNGQTSATVSITDTAPALLKLATVSTGTVKYSTNGSAASNTASAKSAFEGAVGAIVAGTFSGNVSVAQVGNDIVWSVTTS